MLSKIIKYLLACRAVHSLNLKGCPFLPKSLSTVPLHNRSEYNSFITWLEMLQMDQANWIVDVGANHGDFSHAAKTYYTSTRCLLIEPLPQLHDELAKKCNIFHGAWTLEKCALGATNCVMPLFISQNDAIGSLAGFSDEYLAVNDTANPSSSIECQVRTLDEVTAQHGISAIDILKIDVEGFEFEVLEGGQRALQKTQAVIVEVSLVRNKHLHSNPLLNMLNLLSNSGFNIIRIIPSFFAQRETWKPVEFNILARRSNDSKF